MATSNTPTQPDPTGNPFPEDPPQPCEAPLEPANDEEEETK